MDDFMRRQQRVKEKLATIEGCLEDIKDTVLAAANSALDRNKHHYDKAIGVCYAMEDAVLRGHKDLNEIATALGGGDDKDPPDGP